MFRLLLAASLVSAPVQDSAHVVLVATTDVHGHATAWDYVAQRPFPGGLARVVVVVDSLRRRYPGQVVVMDAGDLLQGDPFASYHARVARREPHPIVEAMNLAGYDVATLGNHDFDW
ncbi:MAG: metallophosphoesterase, partial [Gemmatimonadota bacterium]|nr:metallophosphoesterase [Gemmatimonadota bacterium]